MARPLSIALGFAAGTGFAAAALAVPAPMYVAKAGASDLYEKRSSQIVLQGTRDPQVRRFANMMLTDHTKSTKMVKQAAMRSGTRAGPPMLEPKQRDMIGELSAAHGRDRDRLYVDQQKAAHQEALALQRDYAATGDAPALRRAAANIVPVVQHHIEMLDRM